LYDRSTIVLTADHGEEFREHGGWWHGTTLYEEAVHVPLIIKRAGSANSGERRADPARSVDIAPTLMAAGGVPVAPSFVGRDLFGSSPTEPIYAEEDLEGNQLALIRSGPWKLITANPGNPRGLAAVELYNLESDPQERRNLAATEQDKVAELMSELHRIRADMSRAAPSLGALSNAADPRS
jgi:arylsulfatase A-like enzyme